MYCLFSVLFTKRHFVYLTKILHQGHEDNEVTDISNGTVKSPISPIQSMVAYNLDLISYIALISKSSYLCAVVLE